MKSLICSNTHTQWVLSLHGMIGAVIFNLSVIDLLLLRFYFVSFGAAVCIFSYGLRVYCYFAFLVHFLNGCLNDAEKE